MREIRSLLLILLASALVGAGLVALVLNRGGGAYVLGNVLLAPELMGQELSDLDPETGVSRIWHFDKVELRGRPVGEEAYKKFYASVAKLRGLEGEPFVPAATLQLTLEPGGRYGASYRRRPFQRVEFAHNGSFFRVEVVSEEGGGWAYFEYPGALALLEGAA